MEDNGIKHRTPKVNLLVDLVRDLEGEYASRCLVSLMFGLASAPIRDLKKLGRQNLGSFGCSN